MLYDLNAGVNASPNPSPVDESVFGPRPIPPYKRTRDGFPERGLNGLAATVPHRANVTSAIPGGGGGFGPADSGGGGSSGQIPEGSQSIAVTSGNASKFGPGGRNTSPVTPGLKGKADAATVGRVKYQATGQGARIVRGGEKLSPLSPGSRSSFPVGGLFDAGLSGLGLNIGKTLKRMVTPPAAVRDFEKKQLGGVVTKSGRVIVTTGVGAGTGAVTGFLVAGPTGLIPGAVGGGAYGMGKGIYGVVNNAPQGRTLYQTLAPAAAVGAVAPIAVGLVNPTYAPAWMASPADKAAAASTINPLNKYAATRSATYYASTANPAYLPASTQVAAPVASTSLYGSTGVMGTASGLPGYQTPAQLAATVTSKPVEGGVLSALWTGTKASASALTQAALPLMLLKSMGAQVAPGYTEAGYDAGTSVVVAPPEQTGGGFFGGGGVAPSGGEAAPILAGYSPATLFIVGGVAVTLLWPSLKRMLK